MNKRLVAMLLSSTVMTGTFTQVPVVLKASTVTAQEKIKSEGTEEVVGIPTLVRQVPGRQTLKVKGFNHQEVAGYDEAFKVTGIKGYTNNGGHYPKSELERAFDGDVHTHWETGKPNSETFKNEVIITFEQIEEINRIVYAPRPGNKGHVTGLSIYASLEESGDQFERVATGSAPINSGLSEFKFKETPFKRLKFVFDTAHQDWAAAGEFMFYKVDAVEDQILDLFTDSTMSALKPEYQSIEKLEVLEQQVMGHPLEERLKDYIELAKRVLGNPDFYQSTVRMVEQTGNRVGYANHDQMNRFAHNRQTTGIVAKPGEILTLYVDVEEGAPTPSLVIAQHEGLWNHWGKGYQLSPGMNKIVVPDFNAQSLGVKTVGGGPIYLQNPYTTAQQGRLPKVRIEGGEAFPVYTAQTGKAEFMKNLEAYKEKVAQHPDQTIDIVEIVLENLVFTGTATGAYNALVRDGGDIEEVASFWERIIEGTLLYAGLDNSAPIHSREGLLGNIRLMQPYGAMYAAGDHMGVQRSFMEYFFKPESVRAGSWGIIHEIGHQLDIGVRTWGEITNNMWSNKFAIELTGYDRVEYESIFENVAPDVETQKGYDEFSFFDRLGVFWQLEIAFDNYWPKLEKMYREMRPSIQNEAHKRATFVEYSSKVVGYDLTEYFKRYKFIEPDVSIEGISHLPKLGKKIWYLHTAAYKYQGEGFTEEVMPEITGVERVTEGNKLTLKVEPSQADHLLGYEVLRDGVVIGFTRTNQFVDKQAAFGENRVYSVRAVDRALNMSAASEGYESLRPFLEAETIILPVHATFDPLVYAYGKDYKGNDLTNQIKVSENTVDTSQKGQYSVTYQVTDSEGYTANHKAIVIVGSTLDYLSDLQEVSAQVAWGSLEKDKSPQKTAITLRVNDKDVEYAKGLGVHAKSEVVYDLTGKEYTLFDAKVGIDRSVAHQTGSSAKFEIYLDDVLVYETGVMGVNDKREQVTLDVTGANQLKLVTNPVGGNQSDHTVWADAKLLTADSVPVLEVPDVSWIEQGTVFDPMAGVVATDAEDGDLTQQVEIIGQVDPQRIGEYILTYRIVDKDGNVTEISKTIYVVNSAESTYTTYLSDMNYKDLKLGYGPLGLDKSPSGGAIRLTNSKGQEVTYDKGIGLHATSEITYDLTDTQAYLFKAYVGVDRAMYNSIGSVGFEVWVDGKKMADTDVKYAKDAQSYIEVNVRGAKELKLRVNDGGNGIGSDHGVWGDAQILSINVANKETLKAVIQRAEALDEKLYTPESFGHMQVALGYAKQVLGDKQATQEMINEAIKGLEESLLQLEEQLDRTRLKATLDLADEKMPEGYEPEAWAAFVEMREMAREVYYDKNTNQQEINSITLFLEIEIKNLEQAKLKVDKKELESTINQAESLREEDYTKETWAILQIELQKAKDMMQATGSSIDQAQVDSMTARLKVVLTQLEIADSLDRTRLKAVLDLADAKTPEGYDGQVWADFVEMREIAREVYYDKNTNQQEINSVTLFLEIDLKNLDEVKVVVDKNKLQAVIDEAERLEEADHTEETWAVLQEALRIAKHVMIANGSSIDQPHVDKITARLEAALAQLEIADKLDRTRLKAILDLADTKVSEGYDEQVWAAFVEMREMAREVYEDKNTNQQEINSMTLFLEIELNHLESSVASTK